MTRINLIPVHELTRLHLIAEYRELPRVFQLAHNAHIRHGDCKGGWKKNQPATYVMGKGHMTFFYDKLAFLSDRHQELVSEMLRRGYVPTMTESLRSQWCDQFPMSYWQQSWKPSQAEIAISRARIKARLAGDITGKYTAAELRKMEEKKNAKR